MDGFSMIFLFAMFTPGLIRGAFWYDSPSLAGIFWILATIPAVLGVGWLASQVFRPGIGPTIIMTIFLIYINYLALRGSSFGSRVTSNADDIDGDVNE